MSALGNLGKLPFLAGCRPSLTQFCIFYERAVISLTGQGKSDLSPVFPPGSGESFRAFLAGCHIYGRRTTSGGR